MATVLILVPAAPAQTPDDVSGDWQLTTTALLTDRPEADAEPAKGEVVTECTFVGTANLSQDGASFEGPAELDLTDGPMFKCPPVLTGTLSGQAGVGTVDMGMILDATPDGVAEFTGAAPQRGAGPGSGYAGTFLVTAGAFSGVSGNWSAIRGAPAGVEIPALAGYGLAALAAMLLAAATFLLRRQRA